MSDWLKVKAPEEKTGILTPGKSAVLSEKQHLE